MPKDLTILSDWDTYYSEAYHTWNSLYPESERDLRYYLGAQLTDAEKRSLREEGRSEYIYNQIKPMVDMLSGYQRSHRHSSVVSPVEDSDQETADQITKALISVMQYSDGYQTISDCFSGALKTGWNLMSIWKDYRDDPLDGDIKFGREPYSGFITDPYFTKLDFSDCNYILRRKYIGVDQVSSLLPKYEKEVRELNKFGWERDDKFTWLPFQSQPNGDWIMAYDEFYEQRWKNVPMVVDMETGETMEWPEKQERLGLFLQMYPQFKVVKRPKRFIRLHTIVNNQLIETKENPYGLDEYPFVPFVCMFEPESDDWSLKIQSFVRQLIDPQRQINKIISQMVDIRESQINSGWIATENSVVNPQSLFQTGQGKVIWRREDSQPGSLERIPPAQLPPSDFQLHESIKQSMMDTAGINDAAFGQTQNASESGVMMLLRQGAAILNQQGLFDNLRLSQKEISRKAVKLIQTFSPQKIQRLINQQPTEQFFDPELSKYDIVVQEGVLTDTQKQMYFRQLVELQQLGAPVTAEMLARAAPIQGKSEYIKDLQEMEQQQAQAQQQQQQVEQALLNSQMQAQQAKAMSDMALSQERMTRSNANIGLSQERASEAVQNRSQSVLDQVKAIKELETMDLDNLQRGIAITEALQSDNKKDEEQEKAQGIALSQFSSPQSSMGTSPVEQENQGVSYGQNV